MICSMMHERYKAQALLYKRSVRENILVNQGQQNSNGVICNDEPYDDSHVVDMNGLVPYLEEHYNGKTSRNQ